MTIEEKYKIAVLALQQYALKRDETICTLDEDDTFSNSTSFESAGDIAIKALDSIGEPHNESCELIIFDPKYDEDTNAHLIELLKRHGRDKDLGQLSHLRK